MQKALTTFFCLKTFYVGGSIHNFRSRYPELTKKLGISESTLRKRLGLLKQAGLCQVEDRHLVLKGRNFIKALFQFKTYKTVKIQLKDFEGNINKLTEHIQLLVLLKNKENQCKQLLNNFIQEGLKYEGIENTNNLSTGEKKLRKKIRHRVIENFEQIFYKHKQRFIRSFNLSSEECNLETFDRKIVPLISLSRRKVSILIKHTDNSKMGYEIVKKLKNSGLLEDIPSYCLVDNQCCEQKYLKLYRQISPKFVYRKTVSSLFVRHSNIISSIFYQDYFPLSSRLQTYNKYSSHNLLLQG